MKNRNHKHMTTKNTHPHNLSSVDSKQHKSNENALPMKNIETHFEVSFDEDRLAESNYYRCALNEKGLYRLIYNRRVFHLLVPEERYIDIKEFKTEKEVVLRQGIMIIDSSSKQTVEILFDDHSSNPFCIHLSVEQFQLLLTKEFDRKKFPLRIYIKSGLVYETIVYVRTDQNYALPCLKAVKPQKFTFC